MPLIMNASSKEQQVQVHGAWFTFTPGQIKEMNEDKVFFLVSQRSYLGFVAVPDAFADLEYRSTEAGKAKLEDLRKEGVQNRIKHLEWLKNNELTSLRKDMDRANIKAQTESEMSTESFKALKGALEELKGYQAKSADATKERAEQIAELLSAIEE